jgi:hypothetical protein
MHDDIKIHDFGFIQEASTLLKKFVVIGNGRGEGGVSYTSVRGHPYAYAHSSWKPSSFEFNHPTVRGSFFATTREVINQIRKFEVYWDPFKISIGFGNWSTKATCGKVAEMFGSDSFGYFSDTFGSSPYITEFIRGEEGGELHRISGVNKSFYDLIKRISRVYVELLYKEKELHPRTLWLICFNLIIKLFSGKLY